MAKNDFFDHPRPPSWSAIRLDTLVGKLSITPITAALKTILAEVRSGIRFLGGVLGQGRRALHALASPIVGPLVRFLRPAFRWRTRPVMAADTAKPPGGPAGTAKDARRRSRRRERGRLEPEVRPGGSRTRPSPDRQTGGGRSAGNRVKRDRPPKTASKSTTNPAVNHTVRSARPGPESWPVLDIEALLQRGGIRPGEHTGGKLSLSTQGGLFSADYEADMTDPRRSWLRLHFCTIDPRTGFRRVRHQQLWLVQDGAGWLFANRTRMAKRIYLRPDGGPFRFPPDSRRTSPRSQEPAARPQSKRPRTLARAKKRAGPIAIHIDELIARGIIKAGQYLSGGWDVHVGDTVVPMRFTADMFDPGNARLWVHVEIPDEAGHRRSVSQEIVLAPGGGRLWFKDQGRIYERVVLRGNRFVPPQPPRFPKNPPTSVLQEPVESPAADMRDTADCTNGVTNPASARRVRWLPMMLAGTNRFVAPIFRRSSWADGIVARARAVQAYLVRFAAGTSRLMGRMTIRFVAYLRRWTPSGPAV